MLPSKTTSPPKITAINPAAGPLIAKWPPRKKVVTTPPIIAESTPAIGETSEATAIPKAKGKATSETLSAAEMSFLQFSFSPFSPVAGILLLIFMGYNIHICKKKLAKKLKYLPDLFDHN